MKTFMNSPGNASTSGAPSGGPNSPAHAQPPSGPYRAEFGAIHHEGTTGFIFTVHPPRFATEVARGLNADELSAELLSSLRCMTALVRLKYGNLDPDVNVALDAAVAAIAKAEGRS